MAYKTEAQKKLDKKTEADKKAAAKAEAKKAAKPAAKKAPKETPAEEAMRLADMAQGERKGPKKSPPRPVAAKVVEFMHPPLKPLVDPASAQPPIDISNEDLAMQLAEEMTKRSDLPPGTRIEMWNGKPTIMVPTGETVQQQNFERPIMEPAGAPPPALEATLALAKVPTAQYKQKYFREAMADLERLRSYTHAPVVPGRVLGYAMDVLLADSADAAQKAADLCHRRGETHFLAEWARGLIPGPISPEGQEKSAKKLEALADFIERQGSEEKAKAYRAEAAEIRSADLTNVQNLPKQELDMSMLTAAQQKILLVIRDNGGAITADDLNDRTKATPEEIKDLLKTGHLVNPREGVYRIEEERLAKQDQPKVKGIPRAKKPKAEKAEKAAKTPKAPKVVDPNAPPKPPRKTGEIVNPTGKCLCGCGTDCAQTSRFKPGHDAKLHGAIVKAARADDKARPAMLKALPMDNATTVAYLKQAPWMTAEVAKAVGI